MVALKAPCTGEPARPGMLFGLVHRLRALAKPWPRAFADFLASDRARRKLREGGRGGQEGREGGAQGLRSLHELPEHFSRTCLAGCVLAVARRGSADSQGGGLGGWLTHVPQDGAAERQAGGEGMGVEGEQPHRSLQQRGSPPAESRRTTHPPHIRRLHPHSPPTRRAVSQALQRHRQAIFCIPLPSLMIGRTH